MVELYEKKIKRILKSLDIELFQLEFKDDNFLQYVKNYVDEKGNNIYHLLFKSKPDFDKIQKINEIVDFLIDSNIPAYGLNNDNKLPYDLSKNYSIYATIKITGHINNQLRDN